MGFSTLFMKRPRITPPNSGANIRIRMGLFGSGSPQTAASFDVNPNAVPGIYSYHQGDIFTPGAQNFVFEPNFELPIVTIWGNAFIRHPNTFNPRQPAQFFSNPNVFNNGLGGQMAGQMALQPLLSNETGGS